MSAPLHDLQRKGLVGAAIVFTMAAYSAAICGLMVAGGLGMHSSLSRTQANGAASVFWLFCMVQTWRFLRRSRPLWLERASSLSLFYTFQLVTLALCIAYAAFSGSLESPTLLWCGFLLEVTVAFFYFSYVFLGLTLRHAMPRSSVPGFVLALAAVWWSSKHLPGL